MNRSFIRGLLTVAIDLLIALAVLLALRQIVVFSAQLSAMGWARAINALGRPLVIPFGAPDIKTPYGGVFDVDNALTIATVLLAEWGLTLVRDRT